MSAFRSPTASQNRKHCDAMPRSCEVVTISDARSKIDDSRKPNSVNTFNYIRSLHHTSLAPDSEPVFEESSTLTRRSLLVGAGATGLILAVPSPAKAVWPWVFRIGLSAFVRFTTKTVFRAGARRVGRSAISQSTKNTATRASASMRRGNFTKTRRTTYGVSANAGLRLPSSHFGTIAADNPKGVTCAAFFNQRKHNTVLLEAPELVVLDRIADVAAENAPRNRGYNAREIATAQTNFLYPIAPIKKPGFYDNWTHKDELVFRTPLGKLEMFIREDGAEFATYHNSQRSPIVSGYIRL